MVDGPNIWINNSSLAMAMALPQHRNWFLAAKSDQRKPYIITSLINHMDFGLGIAVWIIVFRRFIS